MHGPGIRQRKWTLVVERAAVGVDDAAEKGLAHAYGQWKVGALHEASGAEAGRFFERHQNGRPAAHAHHFRADTPAVGVVVLIDMAELTDGGIHVARSEERRVGRE